MVAMDNEIKLFNAWNGPYMPPLRIVHKCAHPFPMHPGLDRCLWLIPIADPNMLPAVQVDRGAIKFVLGGANVMCPGLTSAGGRLPDGLKKGDVVVRFSIGIPALPYRCPLLTRRGWDGRSSWQRGSSMHSPSASCSCHRKKCASACAVFSRAHFSLFFFCEKTAAKSIRATALKTCTISMMACGTPTWRPPNKHSSLFLLLSLSLCAMHSIRSM